VPLQPIFYNVQSAVPYLPTSGIVGVLAAWRWLIELPEELNHPVGDRLA
jgi:hypothetical protein